MFNFNETDKKELWKETLREIFSYSTVSMDKNRKMKVLGGLIEKNNWNMENYHKQLNDPTNDKLGISFIKGRIEHGQELKKIF